MQNNINLKQFSTAFPAFPSQDQFGRPVAVFPGMTVLDYAAITIYSNNAADLSPEEAVQVAKTLIQALTDAQNDDLSKSESVLTSV